MRYYLLLFLLASCASIPKQIQRARETLNTNPPAGALYCAETFPAKDSLIKGDTVLIRDTVTEPGPVVEVKVNDTVTVRAQCPPTRTIHDMRTTHDTIIRIDRAAVEACQGMLGQAVDRGLVLSRENDDLKAENQVLRKRLNKGFVFPWWLVILLGLLGAGAGWLRLKKLI